MLKQRTLKKATQDHRRGLHTGARVEMTLRPAPVDTGIVFHRTDLARPVDHSRASRPTSAIRGCRPP